MAEDFLSKAFRALYPSQYASFAMLLNIALVVSRLAFSYKQLLWLLDFRKVANDPVNGWLDLSKLPLVFHPGPSSLFP